MSFFFKYLKLKRNKKVLYLLYNIYLLLFIETKKNIKYMFNFRQNLAFK